MIGFSPITYNPHTGLPSFTISVTRRPGTSESFSSGTCHSSA